MTGSLEQPFLPKQLPVRSSTHRFAAVKRIGHSYKLSLVNTLPPLLCRMNNRMYCFTARINGQQLITNQEAQKLLYYLFPLLQRTYIGATASVVSARIHISGLAKPDYFTQRTLSLAKRQWNVIFCQLCIRDKLERLKTSPTKKSRRTIGFTWFLLMCSPDLCVRWYVWFTSF